MKVCLYVNQITPHLLPLARELVSILGDDEVRYVFDRDLEKARSELGWDMVCEQWIINKNENPKEANKWINESAVLICERRELDVWEHRVKRGCLTYYTSERWFKPIYNHLPGWLRLLNPSFFKMARQAVMLFDKYPDLFYLCDGFYAASDFIKLVKFMHGNVFALFLNFNIEFENKPFGAIDCDGIMWKQLKMWGYFVAPGAEKECDEDNDKTRTKVLWVGRFLDWKRVDTLIRAVKLCKSIDLDIYGSGPEKNRLMHIASDCDRIKFFHPVPVSEVRNLMHNHDVYVLPSNGYEGWGAVVSEALEEHMCVYGSCEAGASRTMLPIKNLFHCWDWKMLACLLQSSNEKLNIGKWSARYAAITIINNI